MADNKKVRNAKEEIYKGITFKSRLEVSLYKVLEEQGLNPKYEPYKFHIWEGFHPTVPFYVKEKSRKTKVKEIQLKKSRILDITYTPDIVFTYGDYTVFLEVKPDYYNDVFPYKRKLFRKFLEKEDMLKMNPIYAQIGTKKNLLDFINILKKDYNNTHR